MAAAGGGFGGHSAAEPDNELAFLEHQVIQDKELWSQADASFQSLRNTGDRMNAAERAKDLHLRFLKSEHEHRVALAKRRCYSPLDFHVRHLEELHAKLTRQAEAQYADEAADDGAAEAQNADVAADDGALEQLANHTFARAAGLMKTAFLASLRGKADERSKFFVSPSLLGLYSDLQCDLFMFKKGRGHKPKVDRPASWSSASQALTDKGRKWEADLRKKLINSGLPVIDAESIEPEKALLDALKMAQSHGQAYVYHLRLSKFDHADSASPCERSRRLGRLTRSIELDFLWIRYRDAVRGLEIIVIDAKASGHVKLSHQVQVACYVLLIEPLVLVLAKTLTPKVPIRFAEIGIIWLPESPPEPFALEGLYELVDRFLDDAERLGSAAVVETKVNSFVGDHCRSCDYLAECRERVGGAKRTPLSFARFLDRDAARLLGKRALDNSPICDIEDLVQAIAPIAPTPLGLHVTRVLQNIMAARKDIRPVLLSQELLKRSSYLYVYDPDRHVHISVSLCPDPAAFIEAGFSSGRLADFAILPHCKDTAVEFDKTLVALPAEAQLVNALHDVLAEAERDGKSCAIYVFDAFEERCLLDSIVRMALWSCSDDENDAQALRVVAHRAALLFSRLFLHAREADLPLASRRLISALKDSEEFDHEKIGLSSMVTPVASAILELYAVPIVGPFELVDACALAFDDDQEFDPNRGNLDACCHRALLLQIVTNRLVRCALKDKVEFMRQPQPPPRSQPGGDAATCAKNTIASKLLFLKEFELLLSWRDGHLARVRMPALIKLDSDLMFLRRHSDAKASNLAELLTQSVLLHIGSRSAKRMLVQVDRVDAHSTVPNAGTAAGAPSTRNQCKAVLKVLHGLEHAKADEGARSGSDTGRWLVQKEADVCKARHWSDIAAKIIIADENFPFELVQIESVDAAYGTICIPIRSRSWLREDASAPLLIMYARTVDMTSISPMLELDRKAGVAEAVNHLFDNPANAGVPEDFLLQAATAEPLVSSMMASLNDKQRELAHKILGSPEPCENRVQLLWGPPGTGKTTCMATLVLIMLASAKLRGLPSFRILVTAFTKEALRTFYAKLASVRKLWLDKAREQASDQADVNNLAELFAKMQMLEHTSASAVWGSMGPKAFSVIFGTHHRMRKHLKMCGRDTSCNGSECNCPAPVLADMLIVDEGTQFLAADLASVLRKLKPKARILVAGDPLQLRPIVNASRYFVQPGQPYIYSSLFHCLMRRQSDNSPVDLNQASTLDLNQSSSCLISPADHVRTCVNVTMLTENHRMCEPLCRFSQMLYSSDYAMPAGGRATGARTDPVLNRPAGDWLPPASAALIPKELMRALQNPNVHIVSIRLDNNETDSSKFLSWESRFAAVIAAILCQPNSPSGEEGNEQPGVFVVTPHNNQRALCEQQLELCLGNGNRARSSDVRAYRVSTVDSIQGQEARAVVIDYAFNSHAQLVAEADFLYDANRLNVAVTRAKQVLVFLYTDAVRYPPAACYSSEAHRRAIAYIAHIQAKADVSLVVTLGDQETTLCPTAAGLIGSVADASMSIENSTGNSSSAAASTYQAEQSAAPMDVTGTVSSLVGSKHARIEDGDTASGPPQQVPRPEHASDIGYQGR